MTTHQHLAEDETLKDEPFVETKEHEEASTHHGVRAHHAAEDSSHEHHTAVVPVVHDMAPKDNNVISIIVSRQALVLSALVILLGISAFETVELTRLHQALQTWKALPAVAAAPTSSAASSSAPTASGNGLPSQVGGC